MALFSSSRPGIRGRVLARFPARVQGTNGDTVTKTNGVYTVKPAYGELTALASVASGDRDNVFLRSYNSDDGSYARLSIDLLLTAIASGLDATLVSIAALTPTANQGIYFSGTDTAAAYSLTAGGRALAGTTAASDKLPYYTSATEATTTDLTATGRSLLGAATAAAAATTLGLGTGDSPQFTAINLGHASDTTLARSGAGDIAIEGNAVYRAGGTDVPVADGGTGSSTAAGAATNLGLGTGDSPQFTAVNIGHATDTTLTRVSAGVAAIEGSNILLASGLGSITQAYDAELAALAGLTSAADKVPYFTGSVTAALADLSSFGRSLIDDADASAARTTLGAVIGTDVQAFDADLSALAALSSTGVTKRTGSGTWEVQTTLAAADGGTGAASLGNGLAVVSSVLSKTETIRTVTAATDTTLNSDRAKLTIYNRASAIAVTLPQAGASSEFVAGWYQDISSIGAGVVTITPATSTIDGVANITASQADGFRIISDGSNYFTVRGRASGAAGSVTSVFGRTGAIVADGTDIPLRSYLAGLTLSYSSATTFGIAAGVATDGGNAAMMSLAAFTKTTAAWALGTGNGSLDTGAVANSTWYHVWLIQRSDTAVVDVLLSTSASAPTMPTNYDRKRRIGSVRTNGSAQLINFIQIGDEFLWDTPLTDVSSSTLTTSTVQFTLTVPTGVKVLARLRGYVTASGARNVLFSSRDITAASSNSPTGNVSFHNDVALYASGSFDIRTDTSAQINAYSDGASTTVALVTYGWFDRRGKDD